MEKSQFQHIPEKMTIELLLQAVDLLQLGVWHVPVVMVTGTNGKGTVVAALEAIYQSAGYQVASFTSPALIDAREQIRLNRVPISERLLQQSVTDVSDALIARGFEIVSLSPFERLLLVALYYFKHVSPDLILLEVGLGGRNDAVNVVDANVAVVTQIAIDHSRYLGETRESIAWHKAGIFRKDQHIIISEPNPPALLYESAYALSDQVYCIGKHFQAVSVASAAPFHPNNLAAALQVVSVLQTRLPVLNDAITIGFKDIEHKNCFYRFSAVPLMILDGAHNLAAIQALKAQLIRVFPGKKWLAFFSMFEDKPIVETIDIMKPFVHAWYVAPLDSPRGASLGQLQSAFSHANCRTYFFESMSSAYEVWQVDLLSMDLPGLAFGSLDVVGFTLKAGA